MPALYTCSLCTYGSRHAGRSDSESQANLLTLLNDRPTGFFLRPIIRTVNTNRTKQHDPYKPGGGARRFLSYFFLSCTWIFDQINNFHFKNFYHDENTSINMISFCNVFFTVIIKLYLKHEIN